MLAKNRYGLLLIALICFILFSPLTTESYLGRATFVILFVFTLVGVARGVSRSVLSRVILSILGLTSLAFDLLYSPTVHLQIASKLIGVMFFIAVMWQFGEDIFDRQEADSDTLCGTVCIYLLIGIIFATIYSLLQIWDPASFIYSANNVPIHKLFDYYYFSFITLTTTGFGDIIPNTQLGQSFVMVESITGVFYLAILVAHLTMFLRGNEKR